MDELVDSLVQDVAAEQAAEEQQQPPPPPPPPQPAGDGSGDDRRAARGGSRDARPQRDDRRARRRSHSSSGSESEDSRDRRRQRRRPRGDSRDRRDRRRRDDDRRPRGDRRGRDDYDRRRDDRRGGGYDDRGRDYSRRPAPAPVARREPQAPPPPQERPPVLTEAEKIARQIERDKRTVFVSSLHPRVDDTELFEFFSKAGKVRDVRIVTDKRGKSQGFAYVEFYDPSSVAGALNLAGTLVRGHPVAVKLSECEKNAAYALAAATPAGSGQPTHQTKLYVRNLSKKLTEEDVKTIFSHIGEVASIVVAEDPKDTDVNFAYVKYRSAEDGKKALEGLNGQEMFGCSFSIGIVAEEGAAPVLKDTLQLEDKMLDGAAERRALTERMQADAGVAAPGAAAAAVQNRPAMKALAPPPPGSLPPSSTEAPALTPMSGMPGAPPSQLLPAHMRPPMGYPGPQHPPMPPQGAMQPPQQAGHHHHHHHHQHQHQHHHHHHHHHQHQYQHGGYATMPMLPMGVPAVNPISAAGAVETSCLVLSNLFNHEEEEDSDFDTDIRDEVSEQIRKQVGDTLRHIFVDKYSAAGELWARFKDEKSGKTVEQSMNGRWFAKRRIKARFVPASVYAQRFPDS